MDIETDRIMISLPDFKTIDPTKRLVVFNAAGVWEPPGVFTPIQIQAKLLIHDMWKSNIGWDTLLTKNQVVEWEK